MTSTPAPGARPRRRAGPLSLSLLLLPVALLVLGLLHLWQREPVPSPAPPPGVTSPDEAVSAWTGELEGADGGWLVATLAPVHADARRQAFEARALRRELGLGSGEPWRLSVRWERAPGPADTRPAVQEVGDAPARTEAAGIALGPVSVRDDQGAALESLPPVGQPVDGEPFQPLRTLVAPPAGALRPGEAADWILWGRAPGAGARLVGLVPEQDELFRAATGFQGALDLRATEVRRGDLGQPLARLERAPGGKSGEGQASDPDDEDDQRVDR
jgi:hypothetical protein